MSNVVSLFQKRDNNEIINFLNFLISLVDQPDHGAWWHIEELFGCQSLSVSGILYLRRGVCPLYHPSFLVLRSEKTIVTESRRPL